MISFINWIRERTIITKDVQESEVLNRISADSNFPQTVKKWEILNYLDSQKFKKSEINIVDIYYHEFIKYISHAVPQH